MFFGYFCAISGLSLLVIHIVWPPKRLLLPPLQRVFPPWLMDSLTIVLGVLVLLRYGDNQTQVIVGLAILYGCPALNLLYLVFSPIENNRLKHVVVLLFMMLAASAGVFLAVDGVRSGI